jgi:hypothetical protein
MDANWTSPFGFGAWAWEAGLLGSPVSGPGLTMIDATYAYGFGRLYGLLPADTAGGFPDDFYSSAYNAETGMAGLAGQSYRDQGILNYEFMLANTQSGPFSWWESSSAPDPASPWVGVHPGSGQGSSPHAWGIAGANKVLLDSLVAQETSGAVVVLVADRASDLGHELPDDGRSTARTHHRRLGSTHHLVPARHRPRSCPLRAPFLPSQRGCQHQRQRGSVRWDRHRSTECAFCDRDAAQIGGLTRVRPG